MCVVHTGVCRAFSLRKNSKFNLNLFILLYNILYIFVVTIHTYLHNAIPTRFFLSMYYCPK